MFEGYLELGGNEIVNNDRVIGYTQSADCPIYWIKCAPCGTMAEALGDAPYHMDQIDQAPWYDSANSDLSSRFYGVLALDVKGVHDSTRTVQTTESLGDGGVFGAQRHAMKKVRVRANVFARGRDALDYGLNWLNATLEPGACGQHGTACGVSDFGFMVQCPPPAPSEGASEQDIEAYEEALRLNERYLHDTQVTSGLLVRNYYEMHGVNAAEVEFTVTSERGYVYGKARRLQIFPTVDAVEDVATNLITNPSAETTGPDVTRRINLVENPSLEVNANGWTGYRGHTYMNILTNERVQNKPRAVGDWSYEITLSHGDVVDRTTNVRIEVKTPIAPSFQNKYITVGLWSAVEYPTEFIQAFEALYVLEGVSSWTIFDESSEIGNDKTGKFFISPLIFTGNLTHLHLAARVQYDVFDGSPNISLFADAAMAIIG